MNYLFICRANVGRSQMASSFFDNLYMIRGHHSKSAGTHVREKRLEKPHEFVIACMQEVDIGMEGCYRKQLTERMYDWADRVVIITGEENLPDFARDAGKNVFWDVPDARDRDLEFHRQVRDQIRGLVQGLSWELIH